MGETDKNPIQPSLGGEIADATGSKPLRVFQPRLTVPFLTPVKKESASEQTTLNDEEIKRERPNMRIIKKGEELWYDKKHTPGRTSVKLRKDAIVLRFPLGTTRKLYGYYLYVSGDVKKHFPDHTSEWSLDQGTYVVCSSGRYGKMSEKRMKELMPRLREHFGIFQPKATPQKVTA